MNDWVHNLNDHDIKRLLDNEKNLKSTSRELDNKISAMIDDMALPEIKHEKEFNFENLFQQFMKPAVAFAVIIVVVVAAITIRPFINKSVITEPVIAQAIDGNVEFYTNKEKLTSLKDNPNKISGIKTTKDSSCNINLGDKANLDVKEETLLSFIANTETDTKIDLNYGTVSFNVNKLQKNEQFIIETEYSTVSVVGTAFSVTHTRDNDTLVTVTEGTVKIEAKAKTLAGKTFFVKASESMLITKNSFKKNQRFETVSNTKFIPEKNESDDNQDNLINENKNDTNSIAEVKETNEKKWSAKKVFSLTKNENYQSIPINSIYIANKSLLAVTTNRVVSLKKNFNIKWEHEFTGDNELYFTSKPYITKNRVFLSSVNKKLLVLNNITGNKVALLDTPGNIIFGDTPTGTDKDLFLPFSDGIFKVSLFNNIMEPKAVIPINSPNTPLIDDNIILTSYIDANIHAYNKDFTKKWETKLTNRSYNSPVKIDNFIFTADIDGTIFKVSETGEAVKSVTLPSGIIAQMTKVNNTLYALANDGYVYSIDGKNLETKKLFKADSKPDKDTYLYKTITVHNNNILFGDHDGTIKVYDIETEEVIIAGKSTSSISSTIYFFEELNAYVCGTKTGEIIRISYN